MSGTNSGLFTTPAMAVIFSAQAHVRHMLTFEAALARAEARAGIIPAEAAAAIAGQCHVERFDVNALYQEAALAGTPVIPLVRMLTERLPENARQFVHSGATSQDAIDTAMVLQMRLGLEQLIDNLLTICERCAELAVQHRHNVMAGRTLLQQALPITFGLKAARWLALAARQVRMLRDCGNHSLCLQFGGAAGTLAALGTAGIRVGELLAEELSLPLPDLPWHAERDRVAAVAAAVGICAGSMAKLAGDIILLSQTEVAEITEAAVPGKGGSSAMVQKRNPVDAVSAIASSRLALAAVPLLFSSLTSEHERAAGGWQAEWVAVPDLFCHAAGAVAHVADAIRGLVVDSARMSANLELGGGLLMAESLTTALAARIGRLNARPLVQQICNHARLAGLSLKQAALTHPQIAGILAAAEIRNALDPAAYLGVSDILIDRALTAYHEIKGATERQ
jgi:3-carboxy-cis,cis-muconate cycloisomerase